MPTQPTTHYARTEEGAYLAYQVTGEGPIDLLLSVDGGFAIDLVWDEPPVAAFFTRLASFSRLILLEPRGFGSSGRLDPDRVPAIQTWMDDIATVLDAAGSQQAALAANSQSALGLMLFAATRPERVSQLVLAGAFSRYLRSDECPWGMPPDVFERYIELMRERWGTGLIIKHVAPSLVPGDEAQARWARIERLSATPDVAAVPRAFMESDVTDILPLIQAPTLLISRLGDRHVRPEHGRFLAERIPRARLLEVPGLDNAIVAGLPPEVLDEIEEFTTGTRPVASVDRQLATVLFTDIVGSTSRAAELGDRRWRNVLDQFDASTVRLLERFRGRFVKATGDGTLATFDGPARAIECARALAISASELELAVRAGLHTGEIERRGEDVAGMGVHIAARVAALAGAGEVLVSRTVTDLVVGSGIGFEDRGEHELKGVPGTWQLYAVETGA